MKGQFQECGGYKNKECTEGLNNKPTITPTRPERSEKEVQISRNINKGATEEKR